MSRWIDADALKKDIARLHALNDEAEIRRAYEYNPHVTSTDFEETLVSVFDTIDDAPSIEIVRCKECRYFYTEERFGETVHFCKHFNDVRGYWAKIYADDFCSYGERNCSEKPNNSEIPTGSERVGKYPYNCNWDE